MYTICYPLPHCIVRPGIPSRFPLPHLDSRGLVSGTDTLRIRLPSAPPPLSLPTLTGGLCLGRMLSAYASLYLSSKPYSLAAAAADMAPLCCRPCIR